MEIYHSVTRNLKFSAYVNLQAKDLLFVLKNSKIDFDIDTFATAEADWAYVLVLELGWWPFFAAADRLIQHSNLIAQNFTLSKAWILPTASMFQNEIS